MTNIDRNIRTLISCFVIAIVALVPLRIKELYNYSAQNAMVLGETYEEDLEEVYFYEENEKEVEEIVSEGVVEEIILPEIQ